MKEKGLTLVELLVVILISVLTIAALYESFITLLRAQKQQTKIAETNLQVLMSLDILRKDIELAGFGLFKDISGVSLGNIQEVGANSTCDSEIFNTGSSLPKPLDARPRQCNNSDHLVIRSTAANIDKSTARRWGIAYYAGSSWNITPLGEENFTASDYCIALNRQKALVDWNFLCTEFPGSNDTSSVYLLFGVNDEALRMPFNRVDYYLRQPATNFPDRCEPSIYILYRVEATHNSTLNEQPLLDCVLAFRVAFGIDNNTDGTIDFWTRDLSGYDARYIFDNVKEVNLYVVYQEGQQARQEVFDSNTITITYPDGSNEDIAVPSRRYRWKVIQITVKPQNLEEIKI